MQPEIPPSITGSCLKFLDLLEHWNRTHALTALSPGERKEELIQDACAFLSPLQNISKYSRIVDFGTGMGIPAIVIALARPDLEIFALDKSKKKMSFVRQAVLELGITNLRPVIGRTEDISSLEADAGVAKAVGSLELLCSWWTRHRKHPAAPLMLAKGQEWRDEALPVDWMLDSSPYELPSRGTRYILSLSQTP